MKHVSASEIEGMERIFRLNLINSLSGYKSANLIATKSKEKGANVAVFSSVTHLGSDPALIGFVTRPATVPRNTYKNIKDTNYFTVNHIHQDMIAKAHQTAAKYEEAVSEFSKTGLEEEYLDEFFAPYVKQCAVKIGCEYVNEYQIKENGTALVIGAIKHVYFDESIQTPDGWLRLEDAGTVAINGLDGYALPALLDRFHYARPGQEIKSFFDKNAPKD
ncbi:MAG: flavin oxidoreductase [Zunongwangia sp.]|jgi:flavin reductase (DIM6/NTAB) family NADH-FMN oxidoreductase RutF|uniref:flavin reductase family protein n=1 Tax=Zunongwangia profunda TaxID=398743 RepID=UPI000C973BF8|nr:flavin reductase family protein [Zunongwangia profunda]MAG88043.1 flavin oxidoreductase [Flavobacteriaceae bacterium]MAO37150.1 flavin oxidoreductase [Zunongwangia sp.]MCC4228324.1 flavin reductase family protein [Zunongwangia profunda]|tara:strand:- start:629 stop:1285 length:657 start_codon:yes stop_codon:yes gene_type:complete